MSRLSRKLPAHQVLRHDAGEKTSRRGQNTSRRFRKIKRVRSSRLAQDALRICPGCTQDTLTMRSRRSRGARTPQRLTHNVLKTLASSAHCERVMRATLQYAGYFSPGLAWPGLAWPGLAWPGLAWPGLAWPGLAWPGLAWPGLAWPGPINN